MNVITAEEHDSEGRPITAGTSLNENDEIFCYKCYTWIKIKQLRIERRVAGIDMQFRDMTLLYCIGGQDSFGNRRDVHDLAYLLSTP